MENSLIRRQSARRASYARFLILATGVLLLAAAMRFLLLQEVPPGLSQDEVLNADVASFIRQGYHALFFAEGYGHEPLYHYWSVPFQILLGDNVLSIRLPAAYLGLLLIALTMRWARREFDAVAAVAAGVGLAISWWPVVFSRVGLRPIMEPLILLLFAWFWPRRPWLAGLFLGLSVYTYTGARVVFLLPILLFAYWLAAYRWQVVDRHKLLRWRVPQPLFSALVVLLISLLAALPLYLTLQADPSLQQRVQQLEGPLEALRQGDVGPVLATTQATLGVFSFGGDPRWTYTLPGRPLFDPLTALFFYGGLLLAILRFKRASYAFALMWLLVGLIPSAVTPQAPSTVRMVGAMPVVYVFPGLAISWLWLRFKGSSEVHAGQSRWAMPLLLFLGLLFVLNLTLSVRDGFVRWPGAIETRMRYQTVWRDLAGYLREQPEESLVVADDFYRPITVDSLRRSLNGPLGEARWVQTGAEVAGAVVLPREGGGHLVVPEFAPPDPGLLAAAAIPQEPVFRSVQKPSFAVYELPEDPNLPLMAQTVEFEGLITLVGYNTLLAPDRGSLQLVTIWQLNETLPEDVAIFVHLRDDSDELLSQHDGFDAAPETLYAGDFLLQRHVLPLQGALPEGENSLHVGLYRRQSGQRLTLSTEPALFPDQVVIPLSRTAVE